MTWIENVMIIFGISFEVFAIMECNGSMVANIKKSRLTIIGVILSLLRNAWSRIYNFKTFN